MFLIIIKFHIASKSLQTPSNHITISVASKELKDQQLDKFTSLNIMLFCVKEQDCKVNFDKHIC